MTERSYDPSRRKFILISSAAIASPLLLNLAGMVPDVKGAEKKYTYTIGPLCMGCHYCFHECPAGAIHWGDSKYMIDQDKCIHCGTCYKVCNIEAITRK